MSNEFFDKEQFDHCFRIMDARWQHRTEQDFAEYLERVQDRLDRLTPEVRESTLRVLYDAWEHGFCCGCQFALGAEEVL